MARRDDRPSADALETQDDVRPAEGRVSAPPLVHDRYEQGRILGEGGMGEVHECRDILLDRPVALKTVRRDRSVPLLETRFFREACVQAQLEHPSVVPVFEVARDSSGAPFFTMRPVSGATLDEVLERKRQRDPRMETAKSETFSRHRLLTAFAQVCLTVHYAHARGVLHRDLKPANVMLGEFGEVYVLDWGLAKLADSDLRSTASVTDPAAGARHATVVGVALGTPAYMAPEQALAGEVDVRADVFALGAVLFEILTLEPLLGSDAVEARLRGESPSYDARPSVRAAEREVAPEFDRICARATAADPAERYPSARALHDAVEAWLDGERDLDLRRKLARGLLDNARAARQDDRDRALRDVNRALALSPDNPEGLELLVELLKEPSEATAQVHAEVRSEGIERSALTRFASVLLLFPWLAIYPPVAFHRGVTSSTLAVLPPLAWLVAVATILVVQERGAQDRTVAPTVAMMIAVSLTSILFGPYLFIPGLATTLIGAIVLVSARRHRRIMVTLAVAALAVPMFLVVAGISRVYEFAGNSVDFTMRGIFLSNESLRLGATLMTADLLLVASSAIFAGRFRNQIERARATRVLFAWQLTKLLPAGGAADSSRRARVDDAPRAEPRDTELGEAVRARSSAPGERGSAPTFTSEAERYVDPAPIVVGPDFTIERRRDLLVGREVAMKRTTTGADLLGEALLRARIDHPAIPPLYDVGVDGGAAWFTMKLVRGTPLAVILEGEADPAKGDAAKGRHQRLAAFAQVCLAIDFAHERGVVHGGLEPRQILFGEFGEVYVLGWSHAKGTADAGRRKDDVRALGEVLRAMVGASDSSPELLRIVRRATSDGADAYPSARKLHDAIEAALSGDRDDELRQKLAAEHLANAERREQEVLERGAATETEADRVAILRDLGRALALAPDRAPALRLLSRLLARPPEILPAEAALEVERQIWAVSRDTAGFTALVYTFLGLVAFPLFLLFGGVRSLGSAIGVIVSWLGAAVITWSQHAPGRPPPRGPWAALAALIALATTSIFFGPFFVVPAMIVVVTTWSVLGAHPRWQRLLAVAGCLAVVFTHLAIWTGWSSACAVTANGALTRFVVRGATQATPAVFLVGVFAAGVATILLAAASGARFRDMLDSLEAENRAKVRALSRLM